MEKKLIVLTKVAKHFNKSKIIWAVGGSTLLYFHKIVDIFNDIDIMISDNYIDQVKEIMLSLGALQKENSNSKYKTKYFMEYIINDVEVDIMASFLIIKNDISYEAILEQKNINGFKTINGEDIPLQSLKDWKQYYDLMDRPFKGDLIKKYFSYYH